MKEYFYKSLKGYYSITICDYSGAPPKCRFFDRYEDSFNMGFMEYRLSQKHIILPVRYSSDSCIQEITEKEYKKAFEEFNKDFLNFNLQKC